MARLAVATGDNEYQDPYAASYVAKSPGITSPKLYVLKDGAGCALIDRKVIDFGELFDINGWQVTVAKGIDPLLIIALVSVKDKIKDNQ